MDIPKLETSKNLAEWFDVPSGYLDWYADTSGSSYHWQQRPRQHYHYQWIPKKRGKKRLLESPKAELKAMQLKILREILDKLPVHDAAHGYIKGRSCISAASRHCGEAFLLKMDLRQFFPATPIGRVNGIFKYLGYSQIVARLLTGLCSTTTAKNIFAEEVEIDHWVKQLYFQPHLPQGAPTSPALANLAALNLDHRLTQLSGKFSLNYTRYADDLAFSGDIPTCSRLGGIKASIKNIISSEGYLINPDKTSVRKAHQRQKLTGIVVNQHVNIPRKEFDRLKAILTNCVKFGPASQNRENHPYFKDFLHGKITWAENLNLSKARKLRVLFDQIDWDIE